jgi:hypothetical protein
VPDDVRRFGNAGATQKMTIENIFAAGFWRKKYREIPMPLDG